MEAVGGPGVPKVLGIQVAIWEDDLSPLVFVVGTIPRQSCRCHMCLQKFSKEVLCKQLTVPSAQCPINTQSGVKFGARIGEKSN